MKYLWILASFLLLTACGSDGDGGTTPPPPEIVKTWIASEESSGAANSNGGASTSDPCQGITITANNFSMKYFKVSADGRVYDTLNVAKVTNPYRLIGIVNSEGTLVLTPEAVKDYINMDFYTSIEGVTVTPQVKLSQVIHPILGGAGGEQASLLMSINVIFSTPAGSISQKVEDRYFYSAAGATDQEVAMKASACAISKGQ